MKAITKEQLLLKLTAHKLRGTLNQKQQAEIIGVSPQFLNDVYLNRREPGETIAHFFGLRPEVVYVEAE